MDTLSKIISGHEAFRKGLSADMLAEYKDLATGQAPEILFITCSDSRVDPSFATGAKPGDLFVIRNAGNIIPVDQTSNSETGTVQYAVDVLNVRHIIICGHSDCGAVKALLNPDSVETLPHIANYLSTCSCDSALDQARSVEDNVKSHVINQMEALLRLDFVRGRSEQGALSLHAWYYDIAGAEFETFTDGIWKSISEQFSPKAAIAEVQY